MQQTLITFILQLDEESWNPRSSRSLNYNTIKLHQVAIECIRYGVSTNAAAAIVNATLHDYKGFLNLSDVFFETLLIQPSKLYR